MEIIDLSLPIYSGMDVYPGDPKVLIEVAHTYEDKTWLLRKISFGSHTGTHVDAFSHMDKKGKTLDDIPLNSFFGRSYAVKTTDPLPRHAGLIFKDTPDIPLLRAIVAAKPIFVGSEEITIPLQRALLQKGIITFTGLANLHLLPENKSFMFYGFPLKIKEGDGSPVRAVAILD